MTSASAGDGERLDPSALRREGLIDRGSAGIAPAVPDGSVAPDGTGRVHLRFTPTGREVRVPPGVSVFDAASWNGIAIDSTCGGHGTCKKCKVQVTAGSVPVSRLDERSLTAAQLRAGWRLACLAQAGGDLTVDVPPLTTRPKAATVGVGRQVILRPAIQKRFVELSEPTLQDQRPDLVRLLTAIDDLELRVDLHALRRLPTIARAHDFKVTAVIVDDVLIDVEPGDTTERRFAIAFDLGTTTVVATLLDTATGTPAAVASMLNKQQPFGADVITRISATMLDSDAAGWLREAAASTLDELTREVCKEAGIEPTEIYEIAVAGNATMIALVLGLDPEPLGVAPFIMSTATLPELLATDLGVLVHPRARAVVLPALGAYVGGDIVAGMLASGMDRDRRLRLFIDVGTNCEIVLGDGERILSTAAPAGPAFEGGAIRCGMRAADGAIETVKVSDGQVSCEVIGGVAAEGLCGSGLVDAVAELARVGLLDSSGRFVTEAVAADLAPTLAPRLGEINSERVFALEWRDEGDFETSVYLSQRDVRELQFAKAAISTG
ncbi:MAG TPA: ASKHA domain-containing protein, partial [Pseudonocardiaceae bacterium]|nr:ASKHA domain-containing protein [Pseudonocardiaceae bacterium]